MWARCAKLRLEAIGAHDILLYAPTVSGCGKSRSTSIRVPDTVIPIDLMSDKHLEWKDTARAWSGRATPWQSVTMKGFKNM